MFGSSTRRSRGLLAVLAALLLFVLAACGGSSSDSSSDGTSDPGGSSDSSAEVTAAQKRLDPFTTNSEAIEVDAPLDKTPDKGKKVYSIRYALPVATEWDKPLKEATAALGWSLTVIAIDPADPQATSNAMLRAVSEGADYITVNSGNLAVMGEGLDAAKAKKIPVFLSAGVGTPEGEANGLYGNTQSDAPLYAPEDLLDLVTVDSNGKGSTLFVNAPDFPILAPINDLAKKKVAETCTECSINFVNLAAGDLGGDIASTIVAALRQYPDTKYVVATFDGLTNGLPQALKAAGLDDVKLYVSSPSRAFAKLIPGGDIDAALVVSDENRAWLSIDQIARVSVGQDALQDQHGALGMRLWTPDTIPDGATGWDPKDFKEQYKKLWGVS